MVCCGDVTVLDAERQVERDTANVHTRCEGIYYRNASTWNKLLYKRIVSIVHCIFVYIYGQRVAIMRQVQQTAPKRIHKKIQRKQEYNLWTHHTGI